MPLLILLTGARNALLSFVTTAVANGELALVEPLRIKLDS